MVYKPPGKTWQKTQHYHRIIASLKMIEPHRTYFHLFSVCSNCGASLCLQDHYRWAVIPKRKALCLGRSCLPLHVRPTSVVEMWHVWKFNEKKDMKESVNVTSTYKHSRMYEWSMYLSMMCCYITSVFWFNLQYEMILMFLSSLCNYIVTLWFSDEVQRVCLFSFISRDVFGFSAKMMVSWTLPDLTRRKISCFAS